jgi:hypothetical protein
VIFDWDAPNANGTPLTGYKVYIRQANLSYILDNTVCNGLSATVIANSQCTVPLSKLTASPYNLLKGYSIFAQVIATNLYGDSLLSQPGNGGVIVLVPDSPVSLANNPSVTSKSVIGITWNDGSSDGGTAVIDYRISYDQSTGNYIILESGITTKTYTTTVTLTSGRTYKFKIESRNTVGYSSMSTELSILAA